MARADLLAASDAPLDALSLLTRDHRLVEELFAEIEHASRQQQDPLARRICKLLRVHGQVEEEVFYPAVRRALPDAEWIGRVERGYDYARQSIVRLESMSADHPDFRSTLQTLRDQSTAHAQELQRLLPRMRETSFDPLAVGIAMTERREVLLDILGLHDDDEEGAANQRDARATSAQRNSSGLPT
jgi:Hemerythrin HHE cation binding domain